MRKHDCWQPLVFGVGAGRKTASVEDGGPNNRFMSALLHYLGGLIKQTGTKLELHLTGTQPGNVAGREICSSRSESSG